VPPRSGKGAAYAYLLLGLAGLVNLSGLFNTIQEPDAALYAGIARRVAESGDWVDLISMGKDWLDKPHLPFWIAALSFKLFGVSTAAYKLPAVIMLFAGGRYTYLLGRDLVSRHVGFLAAFILLCSQHIILSNSDVRAEPYLTAFLVASVYHLRRGLPLAFPSPASGASPRFILNLVAGSIFAACAIMTKGIFTGFIILGGFTVDTLLTGTWRWLPNWRWLLVFMLTGLFVLPELYCLYQQFDLHPLKIVFGRTHVSGLRFFFWDSQFGRFTNEGPIKGNGDPFFFLHTLLWAFLPWPFVLVGALRRGILDLWQVRAGAKQASGAKEFSRRGSAGQGLAGRYLCAGIGCCGLLLFSASRFQLPHYTNILFPFFAIICASYLERLKKSATLYIIQYGVSGLLIIALVVILWLIRPPASTYWILVLAAHAYLGTWWFVRSLLRAKPVTKSCLVSGLTVLFVNVCLNLLVYPLILHYQGGSEAAFFMNKAYPGVPFRQEGGYSYALSFYARSQETFTSTGGGSFSGKQLIFVARTSQYPAKSGIQEGRIGIPLRTFYNYHTTKLSLPFLFWKTRSETLEKSVLVLLKNQE